MNSRNTMHNDTRIKRDIEDIIDDIALQKLLLIQPKKNKYIDNVRRGDERVIGLIAH